MSSTDAWCALAAAARSAAARSCGARRGGRLTSNSSISSTPPPPPPARAAISTLAAGSACLARYSVAHSEGGADSVRERSAACISHRRTLPSVELPITYPPSGGAISAVTRCREAARSSDLEVGKGGNSPSSSLSSGRAASFARRRRRGVGSAQLKSNPTTWFPATPTSTVGAPEALCAANGRIACAPAPLRSALHAAVSKA
mmetsp:Transcript_20015/g.50986  ORF Transcript_20015/g.50986 Transcript_20015/m.50986 type:complete len:202 (+) Transcript_20015:566-1171(+)